MIAESRKGDIFKVGYAGDYQFILVFGHMGMSWFLSWDLFQKEYLVFPNIRNPFDDLTTPTLFDDGKWIQFVKAKAKNVEENHGLIDSELEKIYDNAFQWALKNKSYKIITNGIMDVKRYGDGQENRKCTYRRIELIRKICSKIEYNQLHITLISMNDSYLRNE